MDFEFEHGQCGWVQPLPTGQHAISRGMKRRAAEIKEEQELAKGAKKNPKKAVVKNEPKAVVKKEPKAVVKKNEAKAVVKNETFDMKYDVGDIKKDMPQGVVDMKHDVVDMKKEEEKEQEIKLAIQDEMEEKVKQQPMRRRIRGKKKVNEMEAGVVKKFDLVQAVLDLGEPPQKEWTNKHAYSWGYHKHRSMYKRCLTPKVLREQCAAVGRAMSAMLCAHPSP